jgi:hypothetical protein
VCGVHPSILDAVARVFIVVSQTIGHLDIGGNVLPLLDDKPVCQFIYLRGSDDAASI